MSSKTLLQKCLSPRTIFVGAPCLIGVTAIAALLTSMTMGRTFTPEQITQNSPSSTASLENSLQTPQSSTSTIAAQPLDPAIDAQPLTETPTSPPAGIKAPSNSPAQTAKPTQKTPSSSAVASTKAPPPAKTSAPRQPSQSALTMQSFNPVAVNDVPQVPIRVAVVRDAQSLTVATSEAGLITDSKGQVLGKTTPQSAIGVSVQGGGLKAGTIQSQSPIWIRPQRDNGLVFVNGRWYRGLVQLIADQGRLLAVNHVEMQPYLYSVVGAEMYHNWPAEALKAQAIAARSYALVHIVRPASPYFDLGSTQRWQAYKGVNSEAGSTVSAVDQTRGIVISHNGGIVESLYASSAELVREAHRGFGMSQYGARDLAQQNLDYRQILSRFYPGTNLSLLQAQ